MNYEKLIEADLGKMTKFTELENTHNEICSWVKCKPKGPIRSSDHYGRKAVKLLKAYGSTLLEAIPEDLQNTFKLHISTGKSNLPSVLWVSLVPRYKQVYNSMSVTICFGTQGEGVVLGIMDAVTMPQRWVPLTNRDPNTILVNLDHKTSKFKYNNKFHNPIEFSTEEINWNEFGVHVEDSLRKLKNTVDELFPSIA